MALHVGDVAVKLTNSLVLLLAGSAIPLVLCVAGVRIAGTWELSKPMGWGLVGFYVAFSVLFALNAVGAVFNGQWFPNHGHGHGVVRAIMVPGA